MDQGESHEIARRTAHHRVLYRGHERIVEIHREGASAGAGAGVIQFNAADAANKLRVIDRQRCKC